MGIKSDREQRDNSLQDRVVLIINGLSERGRVLADRLARQGADVAIVDFDPAPELARRIRQGVAANGHRCLILTPGSPPGQKKAFSYQAIETVVSTLGRLDAFVAYSAADSMNKKGQTDQQNGRFTLFDPHDLTRAALQHILAQEDS